LIFKGKRKDEIKDLKGRVPQKTQALYTSAKGIRPFKNDSLPRPSPHFRQSFYDEWWEYLYTSEVARLQTYSNNHDLCTSRQRVFAERD